MFMNPTILLRGVCTMLAVACLTLPGIAQTAKTLPPAKKDAPGKTHQPANPTTQPTPNPGFLPGVNPSYPPQPFMPAFPSTTPNRITKPTQMDNVSNYLQQQALMNALTSSNIRTTDPFSVNPYGYFPATSPYNSMTTPYNPYATMNPYQNQMNPYQMNPYQNPYQMNPYQNPYQMNPYQNPYQNPMMMNPYQNPMMMNPYQNPMMANPYQAQMSPYNPWAMAPNPFGQANPFGYNPAMLPNVGIFGRQ